MFLKLLVLLKLEEVQVLTLHKKQVEEAVAEGLSPLNTQKKRMILIKRVIIPYRIS
jgi:hypothetical protein